MIVIIFIWDGEVKKPIFPFFFFLSLLIYFERERERELARGRVEDPDAGLELINRETKSGTLNRQSQAGAPPIFLTVKLDVA